MRHDRFDVCVVGGGPAGSATALCLARLGRRVALFEASGFETPRYGGTLPPEITPLLRRLDMWEAFRATHALESPGIVSRWGTAEAVEQDFVRNAHGCGWHVDRRRFDKMIWNCAGTAGVTCHAGVRVAHCRPDEDGWCAGGVRCRFLVDASGKHGGTRGGGRRQTEDSLVAIAVRAQHPGRAPADLRTYIESVPNGWWYSAPVPGTQTVAMFFTDSVTYSGQGIVLGDELHEASLTGARLAETRIVERAVLHAPSAILDELAAGRWLAVGDHAACHDPLSGFGVFTSLRYAEAAAQAIHSLVEGDTSALDRYSGLVRREFREYSVRRAEFYAAETRWPASGFWRRRAAAASV